MQKMVNEIKSTKKQIYSINLVVDDSNRDKNWDEIEVKIGVKFENKTRTKLECIWERVITWFFIVVLSWFPSGGKSKY